MAQPQPAAASETTEAIGTDYQVPMRDGVHLATTVYLPEGEGPWPVLIMRTPYNKARSSRRASRYTDAGYAYVVQDCRGRYASEGSYEPYQPDIEDGYDTVEWVAKQSFANGKIGITGRSAPGINANLAAAGAPPSLDAAYIVTAPESLFDESYFMGGIFREHFRGNFMRLQGVADQIPALKARAVLDDQWLETDLVHHRQQIQIPMYNVGGWFDMFAKGAYNNFMALQVEGRPGARGNQKLWMGPWAHSALDGELEFPGARGLPRAFDEELRWFDYWLKGEQNGIMDEPAVTYYHLASARPGMMSKELGLRQSPTWPPPCPQGGRCEPVRFFLHPGGALDSERPTKAATQSYVFDPNDPVPTHGGANYNNFPEEYPILVGPVDQRAIPERDDYLRFHSEPLTDDLTIQGQIRVELFVGTSAPDTDFMVKLVDVYPDGYEAILLDSAMRTRYRNGRRAEDVTFMKPGEVARLDIDLWQLSMTFGAGHRLGVHVTSSSWPRFEVNPNTGEPPGQANQTPRSATNTLHMSPDHASAIVLPVVETTGSGTAVSSR